MSHETGSSIGALRQRRAALASKHSAIADADRVLSQVVASAHEAMRHSVGRLDVIGAEVERAQQSELVGDTALGAREFQRFLAAKQRAIAVVVAEARELSRAKSVVLQSLRNQYCC
ncbi:MAG: hypothetical protein QOF15_636 [Mycobacterium sp.]|jgi:hypothetical protein|nr:hypothetical protein [Mycobacterium sp.]